MSSSSTSRTMIHSELHQHIDHVQALLAAAASSDHHKNHHNTNNHNTTSTIGHSYDIRRCLRLIQSLLMRGDDEWLLVGMNVHALTHDLMALIMTLEYECDDPSVTELIDALVPRAAGLLSSILPDVTLTKDQLQRLFPRVLYLMQSHTTSSTSTSTSTVMIDSLLELLNQHLTASRLIQDDIFEQDNDHDDHDRGDDHGGGDAWIALQIVLHHNDTTTTNTTNNATTTQSSSSLPLWVLTTTLLEYCCQTHLTTLRDPNNASWHAWVQRSLLSQQTYSSPALLRQHVDDFWKRLERFGMELLDTALQLLEQHPEDSHQHSIVTVLQYATLAINFIVLILQKEQDTNGNTTTTTLLWNTNNNTSSASSSFAGMSRSLWHALGAFCLLRLDDDHDPDDTMTTTTTTSIPEECQMAATDALWRLTTLHCSCSQQEQQHPQHPQQQDDRPSVILTTIFRLLKHDSEQEQSYPYGGWNSNTNNNNNNNNNTNSSNAEWIRRALQHDPSIRHALQAALLSLAYLPNNTTTGTSTSSTSHHHQQQQQQYPEQPIMSTLAEWIWNKEEEEEEDGNGAAEEDPWQALVHEQLAEYSLELQQNHQQPPHQQQ